jgi:hypothetical protein
MKTQLTILSILLHSASSYSQVSYLGVNGGTSTDFVGWDNTTAFDLKVSHNGAYNIDFWTNGTQEMTLLNGGNLGIGIATPGDLLELVTGGDLNLEDGIIRIGDNNMVYRDADNNVAFGVQNDLGSFTNANDNVLVGFGAGDAQTTGERNVFAGTNAGDAVTTEDFNS